MGAEGAIVLDGSSPMQEAPVAHVLPFWQQPPPREAAHENQPVLQVYDDDVDGVDVGVGDVEDLEEVESVVGITATLDDDDVLVSDADVDGRIYVIDVEMATPEDS